ncbi:DNA repair protein XRCC2 homolog [Beta vulgaris subsp. vulgaris]|uniref:DNA repair protein XRCC2 homolog n=1 Tax=Beta vulgaris subsp. vulgaris TaxID=3555 RepID=UPI0025466CDF|nr:DNA repair protein XRCC2 homolog [Beta vulgaris subsp. vulgaris]
MKSSMDVRQWLSTDETAETFISRVSTSRPPLLLPPLHRFPLHSGNVVEIVGPSSSAKTHILLQVAVHCILPKEWNGVSYGGLEKSVMFVDLDCRFDVLRLRHLLQLRIFSVHQLSRGVKNELHDARDWTCDQELINKCLERFLYVRCYDSLEFLAMLKTLSYQLQTKRQELASKVYFMMIDSIGAYYWVDRASTSVPLGSNNRKIFSLQSVIEAVVREIQNFLQVQPMLVLATKATIFGDKSATNDIKRTFRKWSSEDASGHHTTESSPEKVHREYMPSAWQQSFVTHRISVRPSSPESCATNCLNNTTDEQVYLAQWLLPSLGFKDKFVINDAGISIVP